ncbi:MAG: gamma-glutamylcyclotransferase family protein [Pricia sp.]
MTYLFSYGTLCDIKVQDAVFGRKLEGCADILPSYQLSESKAYGRYPVLIKANDASKKISGKIFELEEWELKLADAYEGPEYKRIKVELESGKIAWLYIGT